MSFLDENSGKRLKREMRQLAAELAVDGEARLSLSRDTYKYMQRLPGRIAGAEAAADMAALRVLGENAGLLQTCARQAKLDGGAALPACAAVPRIVLIAGRLIDGGDRAPDIAAMQLALETFDDVQGLSMAEFWAFPEAARIEVCNACRKAAELLMRSAEAYARAGDWVAKGGAGDISGESPAFFERALQLAMELEKPDIRLRIENLLSRSDTTPEACVRLAQEHRALAAARIANLAALARAIDNVNWLRLFEDASHTEKELRQDPSGVYPEMTEKSRAAVRKQLAEIARRTGTGEMTVARYAVNAAREMGEGDVRRCVCWWIHDDEGRRALLGRLGVKKRLPRLRPDPAGLGLMLTHAALTLLMSLLLARIGGSFLWTPLLIPPVWALVMFAEGQLVTRILKPRDVLRLKFDTLPDTARTLVAIPALLTGPERARRMCARLELLGCLEKDENLDFVLLGDFADSKTRVCDSDMAVLSAARDEIERMNARAGRKKYFYLHRDRALAPEDGIYRGEERKRGALMALCRLATGAGRGMFAAESAAEEHIFGRYRYLVTLDADTRMLPGTAHALVGTIAHPLNAARFEGLERRGFAVMQPRVELDAAECKNGFVRLMAGDGGMSSYSGMASDMYHDLTGTGSYCGKGVIDMPAFLAALEGRFENGRILSHDLIEGIAAGAGHVNDVSLFDGFPEDMQRWLSRLARWTRGDWQLIPELFRRDMPLLGRFRLVSNMVESLREASLILLIVLALWTSAPGALAVGIALCFAAPLILRLLGDRRAFARGSVELAALPAIAYARLDAAARAVWRTFVSKKKLLEWVTSADSRGDAALMRACCRCAAILLIPGLFSAYWFAPSAALISLFFVSPGILADLSATRTGDADALDEEQKQALTETARDTWRFFEKYVDDSTNNLPPDNVQLEPGPVIARRTSPTNIGMYMLSCISARELGFIDGAECARRLTGTVDTLERMEKWNGHIFNWYDTSSAEPLKPGYVSSVDSGNLAASLILCASACRNEALASRLRGLAENMHLDALYDNERKLFYIGADVEHGRMSASRYDLLASEARILSFTAIMLGQIPVEHWKALGRPVSGRALMSWSGTMFEYLMPLIFMRSAPGTLLGGTYAEVVRLQRRFAAARNRPWGVSESGHYVFDMDMNYQYRAFGMRLLSMGGNRAQDVAAPYASCLALGVDAPEAAKNIMEMRARGWAGECGLYEAVDFVRAEPRVVKSWMSHHQGMALCAICNALKDNVLCGFFMDRPEARALELLLNERAAAPVKLRAVEDVPQSHVTPRRSGGNRKGRGAGWLADSALLGGCGASALVTARGDIGYVRHGVLAWRFTGDLLRRSDSVRTCIFDENGDMLTLNSANAECVFAPGAAVFAGSLNGVSARMTVCISPDDGSLVRLMHIENATEQPVKLKTIDFFETALMDAGELRSHPAFFRLFCRSDLKYDNAIIYRRRSREKDQILPALVHVCTAGKCGRETDWMRLRGREGRLNMELRGRSGAQTAPCSALLAEAELQPGDEWEIAFTVRECDDAEISKTVEKYSAVDAARQSVRLAENYVRSAAGFAGLDDEKRVLSERACAVLTDPRIVHRPGMGIYPEGAVDHGDIPQLCVFPDGPDALDVLRDAVRMHEYCRALGFIYQLAVVNDCDSGYERPVGDRIRELIGASHLRDMCFARGGVSIYEKPDDKWQSALRRSASLTFDGRSGYWAQLRRQLMALHSMGAGSSELLKGSASGITDDGYGHMEPEGFVMRIAPGHVPPAPWSNIIMARDMGMLVTERGGGFIWFANSRLNRITSFDNDPADEGWSLMLYVCDRKGAYIPGLPGPAPAAEYGARHSLHASAWRCEAAGITVETRIYGDEAADELRFEVNIANRSGRDGEYRVVCFVDWLMGADSSDAVRLRAWNHEGSLFAAGASDRVAYLTCSARRRECGPCRSIFLGSGGVMRPDGLMSRGDGGSVLAGITDIQDGGHGKIVFSMGSRPDAASAVDAARRRAGVMPPENTAREYWDELRDRFCISTGDRTLDMHLNGFFLKQVIDGRIRARAGFYQAGGAFGFRDQLQDMLALLPYEPETVRSHILLCAGRQFEDGDVMHWWHPPMTGVRTHISDDLLFLPYVTARYVNFTGDTALLDESVHYLKNAEIPAGREDVYGRMEISGNAGALREHCMRALRRAHRTGEHGLLKMGAGDWNDGMNRVGALGRGESVWLSMFFAVCAREFAALLPDGMDRAWLISAAEGQTAAVEKNGWDGGWYLRAYDDAGMPLGSRECAECRIDLISQAWSVFAGCDSARTDAALEAAWRELYMPEEGILRLLAPPFTGETRDPGYIAAYPPGVRENGGQYTHAACWYLMALARRGDAARAGELLRALMPYEHAKDAGRYRVEPYVLAADIYTEGSCCGMGGWTWYTGSAGWLLCAVRALLGFEKNGDKVRMNALEGIWARPQIRLKYGSTVYTLISDPGADAVTENGANITGGYINLRDDGGEHVCIFPQRKGMRN